MPIPKKLSDTNKQRLTRFTNLLSDTSNVDDDKYTSSPILSPYHRLQYTQSAPAVMVGTNEMPRTPEPSHIFQPLIQPDPLPALAHRESAQEIRSRYARDLKIQTPPHGTAGFITAGQCNVLMEIADQKATMNVNGNSLAAFMSPATKAKIVYIANESYLKAITDEVIRGEYIIASP